MYFQQLRPPPLKAPGNFLFLLFSSLISILVTHLKFFFSINSFHIHNDLSLLKTRLAIHDYMMHFIFPTYFTCVHYLPN